jgi:glycosyltransferase involved in cell wall biosynthesis
MSSCDVLFVIRSMGRGGAERQLSVLARRLQALGFRVTVALFYLEGPLLQELIDAGIEILDLQKTGRWSNLTVAMRLKKFISARQPRVVHGYMAAENILVIGLKPWIRRYGGGVACGLRTARVDKETYGLLVYLLYTLQAALLPWADRVISNSVAALQGLPKRVPRDHLFAIPNGVESSRFLHSEEKRAQHRRMWGLADACIAIGVIGRLDPAKNHPLAISAFKAVLRDHPNARLVAIGGGDASYAASLKDLALSEGVADRIVWAGALDDMAAAYSAIDILCLSSIVEGFPNVVAEGMSAGLPCVATDVGDTAEVIGDAGWIVASGDKDALAAALGAAIANLPGWDRAKPARRIEENFSDRALAERTLHALAPFLPMQPGGVTR